MQIYATKSYMKPGLSLVGAHFYSYLGVHRSALGVPRTAVGVHRIAAACTAQPPWRAPQRRWSLERALQRPVTGGT